MKNKRDVGIEILEGIRAIKRGVGKRCRVMVPKGGLAASCRSVKKGDCRSGMCKRGTKKKTLKDVVDCYVRNYPNVNLDVRDKDGVRLPKIEDVIRNAPFGYGESGKIHSHQRNVGREALKKLSTKLGRNAQLKNQFKSFTQLHDLVERISRGVKRVGPLTVYDTALRIGAFNRTTPQEVYLHCGTLDGARKLGIKTRGKQKLLIGQIPAEFANLEPYRIEDCFCICKDCFPR